MRKVALSTRRVALASAAASARRGDLRSRRWHGQETGHNNRTPIAPHAPRVVAGDSIPHRGRTRRRRNSYCSETLAAGVIEHSGLQQLPERWIAVLVQLLGNGPSGLREETIRVVHNATTSHSRIEPLGAALQRIAADKSLFDKTRLAALGAIPGGPGELGPGQFAYVIRFLDEHVAPANHSAAIDAVARAKLTSQQFVELARALPRLPPVEVDRLLEAFQRTADEQVGLPLWMLWHLSPAHESADGHDQAATGEISAVCPESRRGTLSANQRRSRRTREQARANRARIPAGDVRRGQAVFQSTKAACTSCHAIGYLGGHVGPDLTRIAAIRTRRDLLESIVLPSASIVRSYEPILVETRSGMIYNGLVKQETPTRSSWSSVRTARCESPAATSKRSAPAKSRSCRPAWIKSSPAKNSPTCWHFLDVQVRHARFYTQAADAI